MLLFDDALHVGGQAAHDKNGRRGFPHRPMKQA
jgi:hypothetical protein